MKLRIPLLLLLLPLICSMFCVAALAEDENPLHPKQLAGIDFETIDVFSQDFSSEGWETLDRDGDETYMIVSQRQDAVIKEYAFPGCREPMAFMVFAPGETTPAITPLTSENYERLLPHSGERCAVSFASRTKANDDLLISPEFTALPVTTLSFYVKGFLDYEGEAADKRFTESYSVLVSTDSGVSFEEIYTAAAPAEDWQQVEIDLSDYAGQEIRAAIQYNALDAFLFMVDDITITGSYSVNFAFAEPRKTFYLNDKMDPILPAIDGLPDEILPQMAFTSSNEQVATVDEKGLLTLQTAGETEIRATLFDELVSSYQVTVLTPADSIHIVPGSEYKLRPKSTCSFSAYILPETADDTSVSWSIDNEAIAAVSPDGLLTALKPGKTTLRVLTDREISDEYIIRVYPPAAVILSILALVLLVLCAAAVFINKLKASRKTARRHGHHANQHKT